MKRRNLFIASVFFLIAAITFYQLVWAFPPTPPVSDASEGTKGILETATDAEAVAVTATDKAIVPSNLDNVFAAPPAIGGTTPAAGAFTTLSATTSLTVTGATVTGLAVGSVTGAAATADLATDNSTASHALYKASDGDIENQVLAIDCHAASTTITLIPGICATLHNTSQADSNIANTLPAVADGLCFTGLVTTTEDDKTWRFTAAAANTICLGATCGKDDIGFATGQTIKGGQFKCLGIGSDWFCHTITGTVDAGDL